MSISLVRRSFCIPLMLSLLNAGCAGTWHEPTMVGHIKLGNEQYRRLIEQVNKTAVEYGLTVVDRLGDEVFEGRKLLVLTFRSPDKQLLALELSNAKHDRIEFRVYKDYFENEGDFTKFAKSIYDTVNRFGYVTVDVGKEYLT